MKRPIKKLNEEHQLRLRRGTEGFISQTQYIDYHLLKAIDYYLKEFAGEGYTAKDFQTYIAGWIQSEGFKEPKK